MQKNLYGIILAGGSGTRLWPLSRQFTPKQLLRLTGDLTLLQDTIRRLAPVVPAERMIFVIGASLLHEVRRQALEYLGEQASRCIYIPEPVGKNTAPAILLGALVVRSLDPRGVVLAAPSDHVVTDRSAFLDLLLKAIPAALNGRLVTFGVVPDRAETGYGYIKASSAGAGRDGLILPVERFEEKPSLAKAESFLAEDGYYWNSGMFLFSVETMIGEGKRLLPRMLEELERVDLAGFANLAEVYASLESISIDYGIMEKTSLASVVPFSIGWNDLGSWDSLYSISEHDDRGNLISGNVVAVDTTGSLLMSSKRLVAAAGVSDLIVVDSEDAILILPRGRSQEVRKIVERLKSEARRELLEHPKVQRPWGNYAVIEEGPSYKIKKITVDPGQKLSLQAHNHRSEHWVVISGEAIVTRGEETFTVRIDESTYIRIGEKHRLENRGAMPLEIIEVQNGTTVSEDDIVRFEDHYGRVNK